MNRSFRLPLLVTIVGLATVAEAASTSSVNGKHPLLAVSDASAPRANVYFIRPNAGFRGVMGRPVSIRLAGDELLKLAKNEYTLVRLTPWAGDVVVKSWTVIMVGGKNSMTRAEESQHFSFEGGKEYFVLVSEVAGDFQKGSSFPPILIDRARALTVTAGLTPIGDAVEAPLVPGP